MRFKLLVPLFKRMGRCGGGSMEEIIAIKARMAGIENKIFNKEKVLVLSDLHAPFHREELIIETIKQHRHEISTIIFGGDIIDCESVSSFPKEFRKPLIEEMIITYKFLNRIDKLTAGIKKILIWGNHEERFVRYLSNNKGELNLFHSDNILENIVNGFTYHDRLQRRKYLYPALSNNFKVINKWFVKYNDLIVAHPKNFSKIPLRTAVSTVEHFLKRGFNFNTCFIGHTHKWGSTEHYSIWTGELGCLCHSMEYADKGNINYSPQIYGYAIFAFENGITVYDDSKLYKLDIQDDLEQEVVYENFA